MEFQSRGLENLSSLKLIFVSYFKNIYNFVSDYRENYKKKENVYMGEEWSYNKKEVIKISFKYFFN